MRADRANVSTNSAMHTAAAPTARLTAPSAHLPEPTSKCATKATPGDGVVEAPATRCVLADGEAGESGAATHLADESIQ